MIELVKLLAFYVFYTVMLLVVKHFNIDLDNAYYSGVAVGIISVAAMSSYNDYSKNKKTLG